MALGPVPPVIAEAPVPVGHGRPFARPEQPPDPPIGGGAQSSGPETAPLGGASGQTALDGVVAAALMRQDGLAALFAAAAGLGRSTTELPADLKAALAALAGMVLVDPPDAEGVRQAVARFGLFHEAVARSDRAAVAGDLKSLLTKLADALGGFLAASPARSPEAERPKPRPAAPRPGQLPTAEPAETLDAADPPAAARRLLDHVQSASARVVLHQTSALEEAMSRDGAGRPAALTAEIPLIGPNGVSIAALRIEREDEQAGGDPADGPTGPTFRVELAFDTEGLGPMQARIGLMPGRRVVAGLWCERPEAVERLGAELSIVRGQLEAAGVDVGALDVHIGRPPPKPPSLPHHRIDRAV